MTTTESAASSTIHAHAGLIDQLGGVCDLARELTKMGPIPVQRTAVSMWRKRGIPYRHRGRVARLANTRGVELPALFTQGV